MTPGTVSRISFRATNLKLLPPAAAGDLAPPPPPASPAAAEAKPAVEPVKTDSVVDVPKPTFAAYKVQVKKEFGYEPTAQEYQLVMDYLYEDMAQVMSTLPDFLF